MAGTGKRGCFKTGMFGCLGCLVLVVGVGFVIAAVGLALGVPDPEYVHRDLARELPAGAILAAPGGPEALQPSELGPGRELSPGARSPRARPGRLVLDLSIGEFVVEPGRPGEPFRIEADFDHQSYELDERLEQEGDGWVYRVEFGSSIGWNRRMFRVENIQNKIKLIVPPDVPFTLEGRIGIGESRLELGGLRVTGVDLKTGLGDHAVSFAEPLAAPMESFRLRGATGELSVSGLGNASPAEAWIHQSVGEFTLDLDGAWKRDARVRANLRIGEFRVGAPGEGIGVELERSRLTLGERNLGALARRDGLPEGAPTLRVSLSGFVGEMAAHR